MVDVDCVLDIKARVGEGAVWDDRDQALWWVDIQSCTLNRFDPATATNTLWTLPGRIGCFAPREQSGHVVAMQDGFAFFDTATGQLEPIADPEAHLPDNRFNDGTVDPAGRLIAGTMPMGPREPVAAIYRLWPDRRWDRLWGDMVISNGMAFSPDGRTFYFADTEASRRTIWSCDYDADSGAVGPRRVFVDTHGRPGRPDGGTVDADGCYWMAGVGGWELVRYTPGGEVDRVIPMPVEKPTKIAFGGRELDTLYVTSIVADDPKQPQAGGLFALRVPGVKGLPTWRFAG
ncbi:MAG TPA: SMP-30/gluconolactonase/LRE family protein [Geminicoccaceae bacterium]|nr:SMP-30/gluconolactonase/LRE family protein [Geminicoccus sp.]HMU48760.1 SMP-30/gluconolactonase/LRE family protein [Geminicoccaceae bacterium]